MAVNFWTALAAAAVLLPATTSGAKLSVPKILLPYWSLHASNFTIEIYDTVSCFTWRSSRPEAVQVTPIVDDSACSQSAVVTAVWKSPHRATAIVLAENVAGSESLRCDVIVDVITQIEIETTTRELYLEDSPEKFVVRAQDHEGNTFSSLDGVPFEWSLLRESLESKDARQDVLRILTFKESSYETPAHIAQFEEQGLQGSSVLVEGTKTGSAKVQAKLRDPAYKAVSPTIVRLMVVANLILSPPEAYVVLFGQVSYKVELIRYKEISEIAMPSPQYYLDVEDSSLCTMDAATSTATGLQLGQTTIQLKDRNVVPPLLEASRLPASILNVVFPSRLSFVILPDRRWVMETGREYDILVELLDAEGHKLFLSDNIRVQAAFVSQHIEVISSSANGTFHHVRALRKASSHVEGRLNSVIRENGSEHVLTPAVTGHQAFDIYDPITVRPPVLAFPWYPEGAVFRHSLQAVGGSGEYTWSSSSSRAIAVSTRGEIETHNEVATVTIVATDMKNPLHNGSAKVMVVPPAELLFKEGRVEAETGTTLSLQLAVFGMIGNEKYEFADCAKMAVKVHVEGNAFRHMPATHADGTGAPLGEASGANGECAVLNLLAENVGRADVTVEYSISGVAADTVDLQAHITIAAYRPLVPVDPERIAVVAVGSTRDLYFQGGPLPWVLDPSKYFDKARDTSASVLLKSLVLVPVTAASISSGSSSGSSSHGGHVWRAECPSKDSGETAVEVTVGNMATPSNKFPAVSNATVRISCAEPAGVLLVPEVHIVRGPLPCPLSAGARTAEIVTPVQNYKPLDITVIVTDNLGRKFDNVSSLRFDWALSDATLGHLSTGDRGSLHRKAPPSPPGGRITAKDYVVLQPQGKVGAVVVSAQLLPSGVSSSVELMLVDDVQITPDHVSMFNHPSGIAEMQVIGGSGHFYMEAAHPADTATAAVTYKSDSRLLVAVPRREGTHTILLHDLCLATARPAQASIRVAGIASIEVKVRDKVEIRKQVEAKVYVHDHDGQLLGTDYFKLMDLRPTMSSDIISVVPAANRPFDEDGSAIFIVTGTHLGTTHLVFSANLRDKQVVSSRPRDIQVFPPLRINPKSVTLIVGAVLQMTAVGGPQQQSQIVFRARDTSGSDDSGRPSADAVAATISNAGLLHASAVGEVRVLASAVGVDPETAETIVYSEDEARVRVIVIERLRIRCPLTRVLAGSHLSVYAAGLDGDGVTPLSFANAHPPLEFSWSISNSEVALLRSPFYASSIEERAAGRFSTHVLARREGLVTVRLEVKAADGGGLQLSSAYGSVLRDEVQLQVFERLRLLSPDKSSASLLLSPGSELPIRTNRDGTGGVVTYSLHNMSIPGLLSVNAEGVLVSHGGIGSACLDVNVKEDFGLNQSVTITVKVKPVSYIVINADPLFPARPLPQPSSYYVPLGATVRLAVSYHDDTGDVFDAASVQLRHRLNRFDQVQVMPGSRNGSFVISSSKVSQFDWGGTVLKVWDSNNPSIADYVNINVQYGIRGINQTYTVGDIVCFGYPGAAGSWKWSASTSQLKMESSSGVALVVGPPGPVSVTYANDATFTTHGEVFVNELSSLQISSVSYKYVTATKEDYLLPVLINGRSSLQCSASELGGYVPTTFPFSCEIEWSDRSSTVDIGQLFAVSPSWQKEVGYLCRLSARAASALPPAAESKIDSDIVVSVTSLSSVDFHLPLPIADSSLTLSFLPRITLLTTEVHLSTDQPVQDVVLITVDRVATLIKVRVLSSVLSRIAVGGMTRDTAEPSSYRIRVQLNTAATSHVSVVPGDETFVELECRETGDKYKVPVVITSYAGGSNKSAVVGGDSLVSRLAWIVPSNTSLLLLIAVTAVCLFCGCYMVAPKSTWQSSSDVSHTAPIPPPSSGSPFLDRTATSPWITRSSPQKASRVALWSSGYQPQDTSAGDVSLFKTSPVRTSPKH